MEKFRKLKASEIDVRVSTINEKGLTLLLYKDARCDMNILDETVGQLGWQRKHSRENANCIVSIYDKDNQYWVEKEDTGTESFTEKEKGLASDSFKRACFNWGIGRELYTAPFIWISASSYNVTKKNGKDTTYDKFKVDSIGYSEEGIINKLVISNTKTRKVAYAMGKSTPTPKAPEIKPEPKRQTAAEVSLKAQVDELREEFGVDFVNSIIIANKIDLTPEKVDRLKMLVEAEVIKEAK